jgi:predicted esterase
MRHLTAAIIVIGLSLAATSASAQYLSGKQIAQVEAIEVTFSDVSELPIHGYESNIAKANIIALIGGVGLKNTQGQSKNFLVTQKTNFIRAGINFYLFPNWSEKEKATYRLRGSKKRANRILNLLSELGKRNSLPTYLVGFSRGSVDAANFSKLFSGKIKGIVLASGIYKNSSKKAGFFSMERIIGSESDVSVLVAHHQKDDCKVTTFQYAKNFYEKLLAPRKKLLVYTDGVPTGRKCGPLHHHGFEGIQDKVSDDIAAGIVSDAIKQ